MALVLCFGTVVLADQLMQSKVRDLQDPATINQTSGGFQVSMETYLTVVYEDHALIKKRQLFFIVVLLTVQTRKEITKDCSYLD